MLFLRCSDGSLAVTDLHSTRLVAYVTAFTAAGPVPASPGSTAARKQLPGNAPRGGTGPLQVRCGAHHAVWMARTSLRLPVPRHTCKHVKQKTPKQCSTPCAGLSLSPRAPSVRGRVPRLRRLHLRRRVA